MSRRLAVVVLMLSLAGAGRAEAPAAGPPRGTSDPRVTSARAVLAAVVKAAAQNHRLPRLDDVGANGPYRRVGDNLTVYYIRAGAAAARRLPAEQAAPAFLLALGIALDDSLLLRQSLVTGALWRKVETDGERLRRLRVLGEPTLYGRHDLAQHFAVSAALTASSGAAAAETAGILKEMLDARAGGSGFSFADLAADFSGIAFARRLLAQPSVLASIEQSFTPTDYALSPTGLAEGLSAAGFARQYGSIQDARFRRMLAYIRRRIHALPGYWTLDTKKFSREP
jgi:hypothetical protein